MIVIGQIARAHGRRGEVIVNIETDFPEQRFRPNGTVYALRDGSVRALRMTNVRFQSGRPVVAVDGIGTIDEASEMAGCELRVPASAQQPLPADVYYEHELVGCTVRTVNDTLVGTVTEVQGVPGANRLLVRSARTGEDVDVPLAESICVRVDPDHKVVIIDPPDGLLELNRAD